MSVQEERVIEVQGYQSQGRGQVESCGASNFRVKWGAKKRKTGSNGSQETLNWSELS